MRSDPVSVIVNTDAMGMNGALDMVNALRSSVDWARHASLRETLRPLGMRRGATRDASRAAQFATQRLQVRHVRFTHDASPLCQPAYTRSHASRCVSQGHVASDATPFVDLFADAAHDGCSAHRAPHDQCSCFCSNREKIILVSSVMKI